MTRQFRVRNPQVVDDTIEGGVIVIDLDSGTYYSLRETSAEIWHCIKAGADEASIGDSLAERYAASREEIESAVSRLLAADPEGARRIASGPLDGCPRYSAGEAVVGATDHFRCSMPLMACSKPSSAKRR